LVLTDSIHLFDTQRGQFIVPLGRWLAPHF
jgi:hypothetical protein